MWEEWDGCDGVVERYGDDSDYDDAGRFTNDGGGGCERGADGDGFADGCYGDGDVQRWDNFAGDGHAELGVGLVDDELFDDGHAGVDGDVWRFVDVCGEYFGGGGCDGDGFNERLFGDA